MLALELDCWAPIDRLAWTLELETSWMESWTWMDEDEERLSTRIWGANEDKDELLEVVELFSHFEVLNKQTFSLMHQLQPQFVVKQSLQLSYSIWWRWKI